MVLSCLFPGKQAKIVQELIANVDVMFLNLEKCVWWMVLKPLAEPFHVQRRVLLLSYLSAI